MHWFNPVGCHCRVTMLTIVGEACKHRVDSTRCLQQLAIKFEVLGLQRSPPSPNARLQCSPPSPNVKSVELQRSPPSPNLKQCRVKVAGCQKVESYNAHCRRRIAKKVSSGLTTSTTVTDWHMPGKYHLKFVVLFKFLWIWASQQDPTSLGKNMENCLSWALGFSFGTLWGSFVWAMPMLSVIFLTIAFGAMTFKSVEHAWNWLFNVHTCHYMPLHALRNLT